MQGHIKRGGKASWKVILYLGRTSEGKRKYKWYTVKGSRRDAERERARLVTALSDGAYVEPSKTKLREYFQRWLNDYAATKVSAKTLERYREIIEKHLIPSLGEHLLSKLQPLHIQAYYSEALRTGRRDKKGGLSARTVLHHHRLLHETLSHAVKWQLLVRNPAGAVQAPRPKRHEMLALDEKATVALFVRTKGTRLYMPVILAATSGLRRGEILALRWRDIDFEGRTLAVRQSLEETKSGLAFKQPKTAKSRRLLILPPLALEALRRARAEQATQRLALGPAYQDQDLICAQADGKPWKPSAITLAFGELLRRHKLPHLRFHDLRHTHASQLLRAGIHPKVVSERLGHSGVGITLDTYSHLLPGMQEEAAAKIEAALRAAGSE